MKRWLNCFWILGLLTSCSHLGPSYSKGVTRLEFKDLPELGTTLAKQKIYLGGFSGLHFLGRGADGEFQFVTHTDRGPNADRYNGNRPFLLPDFSPTWVFFSLSKDFSKLKITQLVPLKTNKAPLSGLPIKEGPETPVDIFDYFLKYDPNGMDPESIVQAEDKNFWMGEEYAPSIAEFTPEGVLLQRYFPGRDFPDLFAKRRSNRGFEGITIYKNQVWAFLQSPLKSGPSDLKSPILVFDLKTRQALPTRYYPFDTSKADKIGDVSLGKKGLLVLERDDRKKKKSIKRVYWATEEAHSDVLKKTLLVDLAQIGIYDIEKLEGMSLVEDRYLFLVNDNDFQINGRPDYLNTGRVPMKKEGSYLYIIDLQELPPAPTASPAE